MDRRAADTHVLIIGNGPAGLSLSAFLSGVSPFYNLDRAHPSALVHEQLAGNDKSLLDQDLSWCDYAEEFGGSGRPLSVLYDSLVRPMADLGENRPSSLYWERLSDKEVSHTVLGDSPIGGSWNSYDPQMLAVSFASWLDLPGYSVSDFLSGTPIIPRLPSLVIASYMECYAREMGLRNNCHPNTKVTSITKEGSLWRCTGRTHDGRPFSVTSDKVVLACGRTHCRTLQLDNEKENKKIVYDVPSLKTRIRKDVETREEYTAGLGTSRVIVVGDGISSADAVRYCLKRDIPVLHVIRRNERQLRGIMMSRLSPSHYAEYSSIYRLMTGKERHPLYEKRCAATVTSISDDVVTIESHGKVQEEPLSLMAVCIGRVSDVDDLLKEKYTFSGYQCDQDPTLFAIGSFAGDHFVRYLVGGALEVARIIQASHIPNDKNNNNNNKNTDLKTTPLCNAGQCSYA